ncbi:uncharacterized protein EAE98_009781 [Botrytis deweyae]|uniref:AB hydrolase-1 domain-containing protein n=1 Tax=Botrytis deweyae TaxID=2478750 RepID=A0ABQ7IAT7_9HELO|nr:uncharacterized protein EAE98_009781 [Botrytis deweyae]KAF7918538.1 hypothetical protein EAE98_009781 [Botrytis deweyae]
MTSAQAQSDWVGDVLHERRQISVEGVEIDVAITRRDGSAAPIIFLHGFGGSKEDYLDIVLHESFKDRPFVAFDAPGCGATTIGDFSRMSIPFLVKATQAILQDLSIQHFHLVGHSMGGLTALELASFHPQSVLSFVNIKGNLSPEDCFLSRQIFTCAHEDPEKFLMNFIERNSRSPFFSAPFYASSVRHKVKPEAVRGIFESMVKLSDSGSLLGKFLGLPCPRVFMYGNQYNKLSYLPELKESNVQLAEIPHCGHFPMYSNPVAMWDYISQFFAQNRKYEARRIRYGASPSLT